MPHFTLPYEIHYDQIDHIVKDAEETRPFFDGVVTQMQNLDANRLHRSARYAEFLSGDRILGYHETSLLSDDECVFGPVKSRMTLCQEDGRWKCCSVTNSLSNTDLNIEEFLVSGNLPTLREIKERMRK